MENRIDARKKDFKKSFDDPLRRREDAQLQIRKSTREAHLAKKRVQASDLPVEGGPSEPAVDVSELPALVQAMRSDDPARNFTAAQQIRRLLSVENNPPIQLVVDQNIVPRFVEMLKCDNRPDLQFEAAWALTNIASGTQEQTATVMEAGAIPLFVKLLESPRAEVREQAIWALGNIAGDSPKFRDEVLMAGAMAPLLRELQSVDAVNIKISLVRYATWTLSNFCRGKPEPPFETVGGALPVLRQLLYAVDTEILTDACWAISYLSDATDDPKNNCIDEVIKSGLCGRLVELLGHSSFLVQTPALRAVGNIVTGDDTQTQTMISFGCLPRLKALLDSPRKALRKEACWAISNITAGNREQIEEVISCGIVPDLVKLLNTAEFEVKREAAWAISNAASGGNVRQVAALVEAKCMAPLVTLLDVHDQKIVAVALEAIENILRTGKARMEEEMLSENPYIGALEEVGGFVKLEKLQYLPSKSKTQVSAVRIMTEYLEVDIEGDQPYAAGGFDAGSTFGGMA